MVRQIENLTTQGSDRPIKDAVIFDCGELSGDAAVFAETKKADALGDEYEDFPEDEANNDEPLSAARVLKIATDCKDFGNKAFKDKSFEIALDKYQKGLRYINEEPDLESEPADTKAKLNALRVTLNSNAALMNIKLTAWDDCVRAATSALAVAGISDKDKAKALYRRGFAYVRMKDEDSAIADLQAAQKLAPEDVAITNELTAVKKAAGARVAKEKAAYKKFFA